MVCHVGNFLESVVLKEQHSLAVMQRPDHAGTVYQFGREGNFDLFSKIWDANFGGSIIRHLKDSEVAILIAYFAAEAGPRVARVALEGDFCFARGFAEIKGFARIEQVFKF